MKRSRVWIPVATVALLGLVGYGSWKQSSFAQDADSLEGSLARAKQLGIPLTAEEIQSSVSISPKQNPATLYAYAFGIVNAVPQNALIVTTYQNLDYDPAEWKEARETVARLGKAYPTLFKASRMSGIDWGLRWASGPGAASGQAWTMLPITRALMLKALVENKAGHTKEALDAIEATLRVSEQVAYEPLLIGMSIKTGTDNQSLRILEEIVRAHPDEQTLTRALAIVRSVKPANPRRAVSSELFGYRFGLRTAGTTAMAASGKSALTLYLSGLSTFRAAGQARLIRSFCDLYEGLPVDGSKAWEAKKAFDRFDRDMIEAPERLGDISRLVVPRLGGVSMSLVQAASRRAAMEGALMRALGLTTPWPIDPASGRKLMLRGSTVYSVGPDRADDNGRSGPLKTRSADDIAVPAFAG